MKHIIYISSTNSARLPVPWGIRRIGINEFSAGPRSARLRDEVQAVLVADARSVTCVILGALK